MEKSSSKLNSKNVKFILILVVFLVINGGSSTLRVPGCENVSKNLRICEICCFYFYFESTKRKLFEKRQNVCKWIGFLLKYLSDNQDGCFKTTNKVLRLKLTQFLDSQFSYSQRPKKIEDRPSNVGQTADNFNKIENSTLKSVCQFIRHDEGGRHDKGSQHDKGSRHDEGCQHDEGGQNDDGGRHADGSGHDDGGRQVKEKSGEIVPIGWDERLGLFVHLSNSIIKVHFVTVIAAFVSLSSTLFTIQAKNVEELLFFLTQAKNNLERETFVMRVWSSFLSRSTKQCIDFFNYWFQNFVLNFTCLSVLLMALSPSIPLFSSSYSVSSPESSILSTFPGSSIQLIWSILLILLTLVICLILSKKMTKLYNNYFVQFSYRSVLSTTKMLALLSNMLKNVATKFFISCEIMLSLTIYLSPRKRGIKSWTPKN